MERNRPASDGVRAFDPAQCMPLLEELLREGQTLHDLYEERIPLYEKEADVVLDAAGLQIEQTVEAIARRMETMNGAGYGI